MILQDLTGYPIPEQNQTIKESMASSRPDPSDLRNSLIVPAQVLKHLSKALLRASRYQLIKGNINQQFYQIHWTKTYIENKQRNKEISKRALSKNIEKKKVSKQKTIKKKA